MNRLLIAATLATALASSVARGQTSTNLAPAGDRTNSPPISLQVVMPGAVSITNILTIKPDEQTQRLLQDARAAIGTTPVTIHLDSQSATQLQQMAANPITIQLNDKGMAVLKEATTTKWFKKDTVLSTAFGGLLAALAGIVASWNGFRLNLRRETLKESRFTRRALNAIFYELEALQELYDAGIKIDLANTQDGQPLVTRFALSENFFTVFEANAAYLGNMESSISKQIVRTYSFVKAQVENLRINNTLLDSFEGLGERADEVLLQATGNAPNAGRVIDSLAGRRGEIWRNLVEHARRLKKSEHLLKVEFQRLRALLTENGIL